MFKTEIIGNIVELFVGIRVGDPTLSFSSTCGQSPNMSNSRGCEKSIIEMKVWTEYLKNLMTFSYGFDIYVNINDYVEKILFLDKLIIEAGYKYGMYIAVPPNIQKMEDFNVLILEYLSQKSVKLKEAEEYYLLNLEQWDFYYDNVVVKKTWNETIKIPFRDKKGMIYYEFYNNSNHNRQKRIIDLDGTGIGTSKSELIKEGKGKIGLSITSFSNIWFEKIPITIFDGEVYPRALQSPIKNYAAYDITPRFNSFLRDIKQGIMLMGGSLDFECGYMEDISTSEGIYIGDKILYYEDISNSYG